MAPLIWSVLDRILLAAVLLALVVTSRQLDQVREGAESRDAMMAQQIETLARHMANAEMRDTAAEDRDKALAQQISAVVQQHTNSTTSGRSLLSA
jgi:hypothetical protein